MPWYKRYLDYISAKLSECVLSKSPTKYRSSMCFLTKFFLLLNVFVHCGLAALHEPRQLIGRTNVTLSLGQAVVFHARSLNLEVNMQRLSGPGILNMHILAAEDWQQWQICTRDSHVRNVTHLGSNNISATLQVQGSCGQEWAIVLDQVWDADGWPSFTDMCTSPSGVRSGCPS